MGLGNDDYIDRLEIATREARMQRDDLLGRIDRLKDALQWSNMHRTVMISKLHRIETIARNTDPAEACRLIIKECE